ncbi:hypothetical protein KOW79_007682 [Hemibagrus wyckioides]|uniref:Chemokine interleukin-8-like domain-containing protein n=1 Tax=Hemibagrus wyckioides TaxID=337641 RepID=A0A9D3SS57_9TELE|nr:C-C motif chemokine 13-like [Hemibagrus wyckioides]KAG7329508.1 hypothetical protein KOW79_007682 [Hemibagrus wyckioides]
MKMSRVFLVLGFIMIMALYTEAKPIASEICCFNFFTGKIPVQNILDVKKTGSHCPQQGFIVTTPKISGLCVREISINGQYES